MTSPTVSVIIPTYNASETVKDAILSVQRQTFSPAEIIVVDDGSNDGTLDIVKNIPGIRWFTQTNQGVSVARNRGASESTGEWIAFLDADDLWHPQKLELQTALARQMGDFGIIATGELAFSHKVGAPEPVNHPLTDFPFSQVSFINLLNHWMFTPSSVLISKEAWLRSGGFNRRWFSGQDRDLWLRIAAFSRIYRIDLPLFYYRIHFRNKLSKTKKLSGIVNESLILEQWHPVKGHLPLPFTDAGNLRKYRAIFTYKVYRNARRVYRYGNSSVGDLYWQHFSYVFGKTSQLVYRLLNIHKKFGGKPRAFFVGQDITDNLAENQKTGA